ncbi:MAG: CDP-alcohol phosphatidyltransferase family protein [Clostridiales bacterium]|nr:CDP-alcohol phosphatidyltransferase family protein [Clostridiales bacterium]
MTETTETPEIIKDETAATAAATADAENANVKTPETRRDPVLKHFVGYWHYGVILTYLSLALSICGICFAAAAGGPRRDDIAAFFLLLAGLCDAFDGMVAKTRKHRSDNDKLFGMNIDSLSDMVSFGIAPIMVGVAMGMTRWYYCIVYVVFALCGLVRLAYYDVSEVNRLKDPTSTRRDSYEGLPITNVSLALPVFYLIATLFDKHPAWIGLNDNTLVIYQSVIMMTCYLLCAFLFVFKFKMFKARIKGLIITVITITVLVVGLALIRYYAFDVVLFEPLTRTTVMGI